jgi:hypothetical protein
MLLESNIELNKNQFSGHMVWFLKENIQDEESIHFGWQFLIRAISSTLIGENYWGDWNL